MEALRYIKKVTSDSILISHVGKYIGKKVEIIILPLDKEAELEEIPKSSEFKIVKGFFKKYANPELYSKEKEAWAIAMKEKY